MLQPDVPQIPVPSPSPLVHFCLADPGQIRKAPGDWTQADSKDRWTVPLGLGGGRAFHVGKQAVNISLHSYANVVRPTGEVPSGPYTIRFQFQLMFPER